MQTSISRLVLFGLLVGSPVAARAQGNPHLSVLGGVAGNSVFLTVALTGPANSPFAMYYAYDAQNGPAYFLLSGNLNAAGSWQLTAPVAGNMQIPSVSLAAVVFVPQQGPVIAGPAAVSTVALPAQALGWPVALVMTWDKANWQCRIWGKACPGAVITVRVNGVPIPIPGGTADANGNFPMFGAGVCALSNPGDIITADLNGIPLLGPIKA